MLIRDIDRVAAVRDAIGNDIKLMVDANHSFNVPQAINMGRELEKLGVYWFEEPISPEDLDGYVEVSRRLDMAVAGGENEFAKYSFRAILEKRAMDIVQPSVCAAGGITEARRSPRWRRPTRCSAFRIAGERPSGLPRRCTSWRPFRTARRASCRCRPCSNTSRPSIRFATN